MYIVEYLKVNPWVSRLSNNMVDATIRLTTEEFNELGAWFAARQGEGSAGQTAQNSSIAPILQAVESRANDELSKETDCDHRWARGILWAVNTIRCSISAS